MAAAALLAFVQRRYEPNAQVRYITCMQDGRRIVRYLSESLYHATFRSLLIGRSSFAFRNTSFNTQVFLEANKITRDATEREKKFVRFQISLSCQLARDLINHYETGEPVDEKLMDKATAYGAFDDRLLNLIHDYFDLLQAYRQERKDYEESRKGDEAMDRLLAEIDEKFDGVWLIPLPDSAPISSTTSVQVDIYQSEKNESDMMSERTSLF